MHVQSSVTYIRIPGCWANRRTKDRDTIAESAPAAFSSVHPEFQTPSCFQVRRCCKQIRSRDEDRAQRAALHCPGQGEDVPRPGTGRSCSRLDHWTGLCVMVFFLLGAQRRLPAVFLCQRKGTNNVTVCVLTRMGRLAEPSRCAAKSSSQTQRMSTHWRTEQKRTFKRKTTRKVSLSDSGL